MTTTLVTGLAQMGRKPSSSLTRIMALGYARHDVSVTLCKETRKQPLPMDPGSEPAFAAGLCMAVGGVVGVLLTTGLVGATSLLPGIGLAVAGPLLAALMGMGAGGATGG